MFILTSREKSKCERDRPRGTGLRWQEICTAWIYVGTCVSLSPLSATINKFILLFFDCWNLGCHSVHVCVFVHLCLWVRGNRCPPSGCWDSTSHSTCVKWQWWTAGSPFNNSISFNLSPLSHHICLSVRSQITLLTRIWLHKLGKCENTGTLYFFRVFRQMLSQTLIHSIHLFDYLRAYDKSDTGA